MPNRLSTYYNDFITTESSHQVEVRRSIETEEEFLLIETTFQEVRFNLAIIEIVAAFVALAINTAKRFQ